MPPDPVAEERRRKLMELRASQQAEREKREEEEKKAAEAAAKGKKSQKGGRPQGSALSKDATEEEEKKEDMTAELDEPVIKSIDDDPARQYDFLQFKKVVSEMPLDNCNVGSILGAMVYQIGISNEKIIKESLKMDFNKDGHGVRNTMGKKVSSRLLRKQMTLEAQKLSADEAEMNEVFGEAQKELLGHHAIVETDYKHEFDLELQNGSDKVKSSPYMIVRSANDTLLDSKAMAEAYVYRDGRVQDQIEKTTLESCLIPGVNKRLGMPEKATEKQAVRESD